MPAQPIAHMGLNATARVLNSLTTFIESMKMVLLTDRPQCQRCS